MPLVRDRRPMGEEELVIQSASLATKTLISSGAHPKRRSQFIILIASAPSAPAALESIDTNHVTSSSVKLMCTVSGTLLYYLEAAHVVFSTGGTHMSGCFSRRTSASG